MDVPSLKNSHKCRLKMDYIDCTMMGRRAYMNPMTIGKQKVCKTACVLHWPINGSMWCSDRYQISPSFPPYLHWWGAHRSHEQLQNFIDPLIAGLVPLLVSKGSGFWAVENSKFAELLGVIVQKFNEFVQKHKWKVFTLPQINIAPEHVRLKDYFPFGARPIFRYYVSTILVSGRGPVGLWVISCGVFCWYLQEYQPGDSGYMVIKPDTTARDPKTAAKDAADSQDVKTATLNKIRLVKSIVFSS